MIKLQITDVILTFASYCVVRRSNTHDPAAPAQTLLPRLVLRSCAQAGRQLVWKIFLSFGLVYVHRDGRSERTRENIFDPNKYFIKQT